MFARAVLAVAVVLLLAATLPAQDTNQDLEMLQGKWTMESQESRGRQTLDQAVKQSKLTIQGDQWIVTFPGGLKNQMTFKIDPSKDPKTMDLLTKDGGKESVSLGIYKLEGDTLTLCRTVGNRYRPKEFKTTAEAGILVVWKRAKK